MDFDLWVFDTDGDGVANQTAIDSGGDGQPDIWQIDTDQDGWVDQLAFDMDGDLVDDTWVPQNESVMLGDWSQPVPLPLMNAPIEAPAAPTLEMPGWDDVVGAPVIIENPTAPVPSDGPVIFNQTGPGWIDTPTGPFPNIDSIEDLLDDGIEYGGYLDPIIIDGIDIH